MKSSSSIRDPKKIRSDVVMHTLDKVRRSCSFVVWEKSYMKPNPNVIVSAIFFRAAIWSCQTIGIGKTMIIRSTTRLITLVATRAFMADPQTPGRRGSQFLANGRQIRKAMRVLPIPKDMGKVMVAYAM